MVSCSRPVLALRFLAALSALAFFVLPLSSAASAQDFSEVGKKAMTKLQEGDLPAAISLLEPAHTDGSATPVDLSLLGSLYVETGRFAEALKILRPLAEPESADAAVLYNAARAARAIGEGQVAMEWLQRSVDLEPKSPAAREIGLIYGAQTRPIQCYRYLKPWTEQRPSDTEARVGAAACALQLGRVAEAEPLLAGLPTTPPIAILRAQILLQKGDSQSVLTLLEPMIKTGDLAPDINRDLRLLLGDAYINTGRAQEAIKVLAPVDRDHPRVKLVLSEAHYRIGDLAQALALVEPLARSVLANDKLPKSPLTHQATADYGRLLIAASRPKEAIPFLRKAVEIDPASQTAWKSLGDALIAGGNRGEGQEALLKFQELAKNETERRKEDEAALSDPVMATLVGVQRAFSEGKGEKALSMLRQEIALNPNDLRPRVAEVRVLVAMERLSAALGAAQKTLEVFPNEPDALYQRGAIHLGLNMRDRAEADLRAALEVAPGHMAALSDLAVLLMTAETSEGSEEARALAQRMLELRPDDQKAQQILRHLDGN